MVGSDSSVNDAVLGCFLWGPKTWSLELDAPDAPQEFPFRRGLSGLAGHRRRGSSNSQRQGPGLGFKTALLPAFLPWANKDEDKTHLHHLEQCPRLLRVIYLLSWAFALALTLVFTVTKYLGRWIMNIWHSDERGETGPKRKTCHHHHPANAIDSTGQILVGIGLAGAGPFTNYDKCLVTEVLRMPCPDSLQFAHRSTGCPDKRVVGAE